MRLAAIYIEEHEYLFDKPQTINFGGEYFYNFIEQDDSVVVSREENENFVEGLFQLSDTVSKVTHLNAIVGENGSGKTTILDIIRRVFIKHEYALPGSKSLYLVESEDSDEPIILRSDFGEVHFSDGGTKTELNQESNISMQSIYYTPHYDYKLNRNFDDVDDHDISFFKIVERDLENINTKIDIDTGVPYSSSYELLFKNSLRHIEFLSSDLVRTNNIFEGIFDFPDLGEPLLEIVGFEEKEDDWNTPYAYRPVISKIKKRVEDELNNWANVRQDKNTDKQNQLLVNKYLLKREIVNQVITLIHKKMEGKNSYLHEGDSFDEGFKNKFEELDAYESLLLFLDELTIQGKKVFEEGVPRELFGQIYSAIDEIKKVESSPKYSFRTDSDTVIKILKLQRKFINDLNRYFYLLMKSADKAIINDHERVEPFINYMPSSKRLSSGEYALLNLFSRLYDFLKKYLKPPRFRELKNHYILMLDEGDLSFHPSWKKRYIKSILSAIPYFFNELENTPSIQILFTTHDPLTLSDVPNTNVIYIEKSDDTGVSNVLDITNERRPEKTFGANIAELISDSFFVETSLVGEFASDIITDMIEWLNDEKNESNAEYYKQLISIVDEPIVKRKLAEMFDDKMKENTQLDLVNRRIEKLEALKSKLQE